jgi:hypothetical protein
MSIAQLPAVLAFDLPGEVFGLRIPRRSKTIWRLKKRPH